jgi:hypothetical protein
MGKGFEEFLRWEDADRDVIKVKRLYIDITEDLVAGILLSQIVYWHLPSQRSGQPKLKVQKDGKLWLAKGRGDWWNECRITPKQFDRAINLLAEKGIVEKKAFKFDGSPTIHVRLISEALMHYIEQQMGEQGEMEVDERGKTELAGDTSKNLPKRENGNYPKGKIQIDQRVKSLTETTTEITTETTNYSSLQYKLAELLKQKILENHPTAKVPQDLARWAAEIERTIRIDKRDPSELAKVITWCQSDTFWRANILSAKKLREKYDTLYLQMKRGENNRKPWSNPRPTKGEGEFASLDLSKFQFRDGG